MIRSSGCKQERKYGYRHPKWLRNPDHVLEAESAVGRAEVLIEEIMEDEKEVPPSPPNSWSKRGGLFEEETEITHSSASEGWRMDH